MAMILVVCKYFVRILTKRASMAKRMGRPPKPPTPGEMAPLSVRITAVLKEKVQGAADANGRSISAEVESRLEQSFHATALAKEVARVIRNEWKIDPRELERITIEAPTKGKPRATIEAPTKRKPGAR